MTLEDIGDAIGTAISTLAGLRTQQEWGDVPNVSGAALVAVVEYDGTTYDSAFNGAASEVNYKITVVGASGSERATRKKLLALCNPTPNASGTVAGVVNGTLGGTVVSCRLASNTGLRDINLTGGEDAPRYPGIEFVVAVMPT